MKSMLETRGLTRDFGAGKGIFDLNVSVSPGEIVGFLGPNGAGKSTTINLLAGFIKPTRGTVRLFGKTITRQTVHQFMPRMGVMLSEPTIDSGLTARQIFTQAERLLQIDTKWRELSSFLELALDVKAATLSLGNKKKIEIVLALMHEPELVILDEPTSGIDPLIVAKFSTLLNAVAKRGGAVLLSSHDLGEVQEVCDRIVMVKAGHMILDRQIARLLHEAARKFTIMNPSAELMTELRSLDIGPLQRAPSGITLQTSEYKRVIKALSSHDTFDYLIERPSLEEMFTEQYE